MKETETAFAILAMFYIQNMCTEKLNNEPKAFCESNVSNMSTTKFFLHPSGINTTLNDDIVILPMAGHM